MTWKIHLRKWQNFAAVEEALTSRSSKSNWNWRVENLTIAAITLLLKWKIIEEYGFWGSLDEEIIQNMVSNVTFLFWKTYVVGIYNCLTLRQERKIRHNLDASAFKHLSKETLSRTRKISGRSSHSKSKSMTFLERNVWKVPSEPQKCPDTCSASSSRTKPVQNLMSESPGQVERNAV